MRSLNGDPKPQAMAVDEKKLAKKPESQKSKEPAGFSWGDEEDESSSEEDSPNGQTGKQSIEEHRLITHKRNSYALDTSDYLDEPIPASLRDRRRLRRIVRASGNDGVKPTPVPLRQRSLKSMTKTAARTSATPVKVTPVPKYLGNRNGAATDGEAAAGAPTVTVTTPVASSTSTVSASGQATASPLPIMAGTAIPPKKEIPDDKFSDDYFLNILRKQMAEMNPRQKLNFKKKCYQSLMETFDDATDFPTAGEQQHLNINTPSDSEHVPDSEMCLVRELVSLGSAAKLSGPIPKRLPVARARGQAPAPVGQPRQIMQPVIKKDEEVASKEEKKIYRMVQTNTKAGPKVGTVRPQRASLNTLFGPTPLQVLPAGPMMSLDPPSDNSNVFPRHPQQSLKRRGTLAPAPGTVPPNQLPRYSGNVAPGPRSGAAAGAAPRGSSLPKTKSVGSVPKQPSLTGKSSGPERPQPIPSAQENAFNGLQQQHKTSSGSLPSFSWLRLTLASNTDKSVPGPKIGMADPLEQEKSLGSCTETAATIAADDLAIKNEPSDSPEEDDHNILGI